MTSAIVLLPDDEQALHQRIEEWAPQYPVHDLEDQWKRRQLVQATLQIDLCQDQARQQRTYEASRALHCWDEDQTQQAEALGAKLSKNPSRIVAELRTRRAGVDWLLNRWTRLEAMLNEGVPFEEDQHQLLLDLLGQPLSTRQLDLVTIAAEPIPNLQAMVRSEIKALQELQAKSLVPIEAIEREMAEAGLPPRESAELKRIRRYEAAHWRRYEQAKAHWPSRDPLQRPLLGKNTHADNQESKRDENHAVMTGKANRPAPNVPAKPEPKPEQTQPQPQPQPQIQVDLFPPEPVPVFITGRPKLTRKQLKNLRKRFQPTSRADKSA